MSDTTTPTSPWALGDYHRFATKLVWGIGPELVRACGISAGQRVLDAAAGTGNVAIRAAEAGAEVVALDITPEHFDAGRREAAARGVEVEWVEGDVQRLPFADGEFDAVTSSFGAMFAPDHHATARELLRVCRPGGRVGLTAFTPEGNGGAFFAALGPYAPPPPPGALLPTAWGDERHVRELLGGGSETLSLERRHYVEEVEGGPQGYCEFFRRTFGPVVATYAALAGDPERTAALDRDLLAYAAAADEGPPGGPARIRYEYLLAVATRARG